MLNTVFNVITIMVIDKDLQYFIQILRYVKIIDLNNGSFSIRYELTILIKTLNEVDGAFFEF